MLRDESGRLVGRLRRRYRACLYCTVPGGRRTAPRLARGASQIRSKKLTTEVAEDTESGILRVSLESIYLCALCVLGGSKLAPDVKRTPGAHPLDTLCRA